MIFSPLWTILSIVFTTLSSLNGAIAAERFPTMIEAARFEASLRATFESSANWETKSHDSRISLLNAGLTLFRDSNKLFGDNPLGPFGECLSAPLAINHYLLKIEEISGPPGRPKNIRASQAQELAEKAFIAGEITQKCREQLKIVKP